MTRSLPPLSAARSEHLRRRHREEMRFKLYGQIAIGIAVSFLAILLISIAMKASSAFSRHMLVLELERPEFSNRTDISVTDVNLAVREELLSIFPENTDQRTVRTDLFGLTTRLAVLPLASKLQSNPGLADRPLKAEFAVSDDIDLYLKNAINQHRPIDVGIAGRMSLGEGGNFRLSDAGPDGFLAFQNELESLDLNRSDLLISFAGGWYELVSVRGATLNLSHLAGPIPALGEQGAQSISAEILGSIDDDRKVSNRQVALTMLLLDQGKIKRSFNSSLFFSSDSTYPELAGAAAAIIGSLFTMLVTALFALPVGILAAVYLEEFARKSWLTRVIEVNINNLAAVPSIIFGLLGAAVFINTLGLPRSVPLVGGLVLGLLVLPTIIIASRAALRAVPPSVRDAALGLGASKAQSVFHHVLPLATPGILTGAIIAMARALGETAPLLLIGMVAFVSEVPASLNDEATTLPVLIYKWFSGAERAWEPMTAAVILILLTVLVSMNLAVVLLRRRFERRW